jgi:hypothetical protein
MASLSTTPVGVSSTDFAKSKTPKVRISDIPASSEASENGEGRRWWNLKGRSEEQKLLLKLDFYIMSWACFGYFLRLLDTSNMGKQSPSPCVSAQ